jgi:prevent-host-death family protein
LTDAKAHLSQLVQAALEGEPQRIIRHGREAVVVVAADAYDAAARPRRSLAELFAPLRGVSLDIDRPKEDNREPPRL